MSPPDRPQGPAWFDISTPTRREHVLDPVDTPVSRIAAFADPDGNQIGLVSR